MKAVGQAAPCSFPCELLWQMKNQLEDRYLPLQPGLPLPCTGEYMEAILFRGSGRFPQFRRFRRTEPFSSPLWCLQTLSSSWGMYHGGNIHCSLHPFLGFPSCVPARQSHCSAGFLTCCSLPQRWVRAVASIPGKV